MSIKYRVSRLEKLLNLSNTPPEPGQDIPCEVCARLFATKSQDTEEALKIWHRVNNCKICNDRSLWPKSIEGPAHTPTPTPEDSARVYQEFKNA